MKTILASIFLLLAQVSYGQSNLLGFKLSVGSTITRVKDHDVSASGGLDGEGFLRNPADGLTTAESSQMAVSLGANIDLPFNDKVYLSSGLWITNKAFTISNRDGGYYGVSAYSVSYLQLPFAAKIYIKDITTNLDLFFKLGLTVDLKVQEELEGGDGAHFWNLAKMRTDLDRTRGKNADRKVMALFNPLNVGILTSVGAEYRLTDKLYLFTALTYNPGLFNMINPALKHDDRNRTKVADGLKITTGVFVADFGVVLPLK